MTHSNAEQLAEDGFDPREFYPLSAKVAAATGWNDPLMDDYDRYDERHHEISRGDAALVPVTAAVKLLPRCVVVSDFDIQSIGIREEEPVMPSVPMPRSAGGESLTYNL